MVVKSLLYKFSSYISFKVNGQLEEVQEKREGVLIWDDSNLIWGDKDLNFG